MMSEKGKKEIQNTYEDINKIHPYDSSKMVNKILIGILLELQDIKVFLNTNKENKNELLRR